MAIRADFRLANKKPFSSKCTCAQFTIDTFASALVVLASTPPTEWGASQASRRCLFGANSAIRSTRRPLVRPHRGKGMDALLLQDWATVSLVGGGASSKITQGAPGYLDVSEYHDLVFYLHVATSVAAGGIPAIPYPTAPTRGDPGFLSKFLTPS